MKICLSCTHGGHFVEMSRLLDAFKGHDYFFVTYKSEARINLENAYFIKFEEQGLKAKIMLIKTIIRAFGILIKEKPDIIVSTGGGEIAVPFSYIGKIFGAKIIFIETIARIKTPSAAGRLVYPVSDLFLVQWESLLNQYGKKAKYWGKVF